MNLNGNDLGFPENKGDKDEDSCPDRENSSNSCRRGDRNICYIVGKKKLDVSYCRYGIFMKFGQKVKEIVFPKKR
jgi:hypothetical protein